ncbi:hypothetical protein GCM10022409_01190 [Hymenobacter glaciei]|uniref:Uncharacterized protein n=1 Tax=Hymenobacter glaciei TaxID=877209 RepID=A0ABP7T5E5_9BACT
MKKYTQRELVTSALLKGKEQRKHYTHPLPDNPAVTVWGTVAIIFKDDVFLVSITEFHDPSEVSASRDEWDVDELYTLTNLVEVEALLSQRLSIALDELGPAKGINHFQLVNRTNILLWVSENRPTGTNIFL